MQELKETLKIAPSEKSYHALAHGCKRQKQGLALLDQMKVWKQYCSTLQIWVAMYKLLILRAAIWKISILLYNYMYSVVVNWGYKVKPDFQSLERLCGIPRPLPLFFFTLELKATAYTATCIYILSVEKACQLPV